MIAIKCIDLSLKSFFSNRTAKAPTVSDCCCTSYGKLCMLEGDSDREAADHESRAHLNSKEALKKETSCFIEKIILKKIINIKCAMDKILCKSH